MNGQVRFLLILVAGAVAVLGGSRVGAQESWVGESVMPTKRPEEIKFGELVMGKLVYFPISSIMSSTTALKVRDDKDGKLRIHDGQREGWVEKADFVLVQDAADYFQRRVQANPMDTWALYMRGLSRLQKGELDAAIQDLDECIRLAPTVAAGFITRGVAWKRKKEYARALRDYDEAIRLDPKSANSHNNRAWLWATCPDAKYRDGKRAVESAKRAIELYKNSFTMGTLAAAYAEAGDFAQAVRWQVEAVNSNDDDVFRQRLELYRKRMPYREE
jgi:Tfp pilus assembly protein PilF